MAKRQKKYHITGRIIGRQTGNGLPGLRLEAWDKDCQYNDLVGSAITGESGGLIVGGELLHGPALAKPEVLRNPLKGRNSLLKEN